VPHPFRPLIVRAASGFAIAAFAVLPRASAWADERLLWLHYHLGNDSTRVESAEDPHRPPVFARLEGTLSLGLAQPIGSAYFDLPNDCGVHPGFGAALALRAALDPAWSLGIRFPFAFATTRAAYAYPFLDTVTVARFTVAVTSIQLELRRAFAKGRWQPYASALVGWAHANAFDSFFYQINGSGYDIGVAGGIRRVGDDSATGLEIWATTGRARWQHPPLATSQGTRFDPGVVAIVLVWDGRWDHPHPRHVVSSRASP
jgi:hypothetical protein